MRRLSFFRVWCSACAVLLIFTLMASSTAAPIATEEAEDEAPRAEFRLEGSALHRIPVDGSAPTGSVVLDVPLQYEENVAAFEDEAGLNTYLALRERI